MESIKTIARHVAAALGVTLAVAGGAQAQVGTSFPTDFPKIWDASLEKLVIGFGGSHNKWQSGPVARTPVIILHGNDGTPYPTTCYDVFGSVPGGRFSMDVKGFAEFLASPSGGGYAPSELWALGWQGDQCDNFVPVTSSFGEVARQWTKSASEAHSIGANVLELRNFIKAVMQYTGASKVDIVAHGAGAVLAREWARREVKGKFVRRFVAIDGPNQGMIICSPHGDNYWKGPAFGGFMPESPVCQELGSPNTPFLQVLNKATDGARISPSDTLVIRNGDASFPYMPWLDGNQTGVPAFDIDGKPVDLTQSANVRGGQTLTLTGQTAYARRWSGIEWVNDGPAHHGIANSPDTWNAARNWLQRK